MSYCALCNTQQLLRPFREQVDCLTSIAWSVEFCLTHVTQEPPSVGGEGGRRPVVSYCTAALLRTSSSYADTPPPPLTRTHTKIFIADKSFLSNRPLAVFSWHGFSCSTFTVVRSILTTPGKNRRTRLLERPTTSVIKYSSVVTKVAQHLITTTETMTLSLEYITRWVFEYVLGVFSSRLLLIFNSN